MNKKGISLIVLVITIIVMIIIAGAIILSLSSSNITGRANLATLLSDRANYQAKLATLIAENTQADGTIKYSEITLTDVVGPKTSNSYGTWSFDNASKPSEIIFTLNSTTDIGEVYGLTTDAYTTYTWLTK